RIRTSRCRAICPIVDRRDANFSGRRHSTGAQILGACRNVGQGREPFRRVGVLQQGSLKMKRGDLTEKILDIKREKGWSWKPICGEIGGMSPILIVGAMLGQMKLTKPQVAKAADLFGLSKAEQALLNEVPLRGTPMPPTDPLIY